MRIVPAAMVLFCLGSEPLLAKEKIMTLSWGDVIWQHRGQGVAQIDTPEKIRESESSKYRTGNRRVVWAALPQTRR